MRKRTGAIKGHNVLRILGKNPSEPAAILGLRVR